MKKSIVPDTQSVSIEDEECHSSPSETVSFSWQSLLTLIGTIGITLALIFLVPIDMVKQIGSYGYAGLFLLTLLANATIVIPSPALAAVFLFGAALNPWLVGLTSGLAAGIGESTGYIAGYSGSMVFANKSRLYPRVKAWVQRWGVLTIFVLAIIPSPIIDLAGIAAGAMRIRFVSYLLACIAGKTLRYMGVAWMGYLSGRFLL